MRMAASLASIAVSQPTLALEAVARLGVARETGWRPVALSPGYLGARMEAAYGDSELTPTREDLLSWLRWCRSWSRTIG